MQIQNNVRRVTNVDARADSPDAFREFSRPSLPSSTDAFAQIFEAIATSYAPKQERSREPVTGPQEVSSREDVAANELISEEKDDSLEKDKEAQNATPTALPLPVQPLTVDADRPDATNTADAVVEKKGECCTGVKNSTATETENAPAEKGDADASIPTAPTANADLAPPERGVAANAGTPEDVGNRLGDGAAPGKLTEPLPVAPPIESNMDASEETQDPFADTSPAEASLSDDETDNAVANEPSTDDRRDRRDRRDAGDVRAKRRTPGRAARPPTFAKQSKLAHVIHGNATNRVRKWFGIGSERSHTNR